MWGHGEIKQTYKHRYGTRPGLQDNKSHKGNMKQWDAFTAPRPSYSKFPQCDYPAARGTKEQVSPRRSKRHLSTLTSNRPKYDSLRAPAATRGPVQSASVSELAPYLAALSLSHLWADGQTGRAREKKEKCN